ncbi:MAG TPA: substrate-binding domain-containing protein [Vicinamibacterales bacterium]
MTLTMTRRCGVVLAAAIALCGAWGCSRGGDSEGRPLSIAVIPKGTTHDFWRAIHAGAVKAERELRASGVNVTITWKGPLREDDREQQVQVVEGFLSQGVSGIVLAPLDEQALVRPVQEARRAGIPTVVIDSGLATDEIVSFVATDNVRGGELAADRMAELLGGKGKVLLLRYQEGSASTTERERGFTERLKQYPGIELISSEQYAGPTRDTGKRASENLLNRYGREIQGVFCVNESSTHGMLLALQDIGRAGEIKFIGFDASPVFVEAMRNGQMHGLVVQHPMNMGYLGVMRMVDHLQGRPVERRIDTGVWMITPENLDEPEMAELLNPPVDQYLN